MLSRRHFLALSLLAALTACRRQRKLPPVPRGSTVLAVGDSLTFGYGAQPSEAYPAQLSALSGWRVINGGVSGDTSEQALARLPELLNAKPKLVLLGIGGNDFLRGLPENQTRTHIARIITAVQAQNIPLVLLAVPQPSVGGALLGSLRDHPLYRELADAHGVLLFENGWSDILSDRDLKSDAIHANARGYRRFAENLAAFLKQYGVLS